MGAAADSGAAVLRDAVQGAVQAGALAAAASDAVVVASGVVVAASGVAVVAWGVAAQEQDASASFGTVRAAAA